jgi:hypothetical protein
MSKRLGAPFVALDLQGLDFQALREAHLTLPLAL